MTIQGQTSSGVGGLVSSREVDTPVILYFAGDTAFLLIALLPHLVTGFVTSVMLEVKVTHPTTERSFKRSYVTLLMPLRCNAHAVSSHVSLETEKDGVGERCDVWSVLM